MMIMAQHPQQQQQQQQQHHHHKQQPAHQDGRQKQQQALVVTQNNVALFQTQIKAQTNASGLSQQQQQQYQFEQDGKRTLIKNQLYLIEQLQLENANLRNERDQLQLENEELKFQLQMISSSNILHQPSNAFNNQQLERLVENNNGKISGNHHSHFTPSTQKLSSSQLSSLTQHHQSTQQQVKLLITPIKNKLAKNNDDDQQVPNQHHLAHSRLSIDGKRQLDSVEATTIIPLSSSSVVPPIAIHRNQKSLTGKLPSIGVLNAKNQTKSIPLTPQNRDLPHDDEEHRIKMVEQRYGGNSEQVQEAAIIIQRAFRKYQICKRFRTITEQLRHTHQSSSTQSNDRKRDQKPILASNAKTPLAKTEILYASGATRAAAWESLSQAASRLATTGSTNRQTGQSKQLVSNQQQVGLANPLAVSATDTSIGQTNDVRLPQKQDPVVAAAINFQQLESIRKRQYRVGLNIFNKNPEKGVSFLVAHSFIDSSSPYMKTSTSYYHSNQLHFIDKQHLLQQQQQASSPTNIQSCQLCREEDNLKRNVAHFLLHRKGLAKEKIGQYLGNLQSDFNQDVLKYYLQELDFYGLQIDLALRKFLSTFRLPGEAQKIEKIVDCFAQRYVKCQQQQPQQHHLNANVSLANITQTHLVNQQSQQTSIQQNQQQQLNPNNQQLVPLNYKNNLILLSKDEIFILTFAIIMLNTDLHSPSLKPTSRMSAMQFVNNLRGVFKSQTINESDLIEIYERVKANQITTTPDHVTHVMKVQQGLTVTNFQRKELPNLCVPHRRLVCFCRLFEVYDINKKERIGQHQREIFLFNDLLLVTKLARRVRANTTQLYTYRQSISLQGLYVQLFQSAHYNFGIKLCQRSNDETLIMFNARNELDQSRFVDDLGESIAEMDEMETIKTHNIIETIHFKYLERLKRHSIMHNNSIDNNQPISGDNQSSKTINSLDNCDINSSIVNRQVISERKQQKRSEVLELEADAGSTSTTAPSHGGRVQAKFRSMLNLSSASYGKPDTNEIPIQTKESKENQLFTQQTQRTDQSAACRVDGRSDCPVALSVQRRCSTSSVHSLDSGLFLSRDVSPNQSS